MIQEGLPYFKMFKNFILNSSFNFTIDHSLGDPMFGFNNAECRGLPSSCYGLFGCYHDLQYKTERGSGIVQGIMVQQRKAWV